MDCTAAWVTNSWPPSSRNAAVIASATTSVSCHQPLPMADDQQVGDEHADRDAQGHLGDPAQPLAVGRAEADHGGDRREERGRCGRAGPRRRTMRRRRPARTGRSATTWTAAARAGPRARSAHATTHGPAAGPPPWARSCQSVAVLSRGRVVDVAREVRTRHAGALRDDQVAGPAALGLRRDLPRRGRARRLDRVPGRLAVHPARRRRTMPRRPGRAGPGPGRSPSAAGSPRSTVRQRLRALRRHGHPAVLGGRRAPFRRSRPRRDPGPSGRVWIDDEDEFADHRVRFGLPGETSRAARLRTLATWVERPSGTAARPSTVRPTFPWLHRLAQTDRVRIDFQASPGRRWASSGSSRWSTSESRDLSQRRRAPVRCAPARGSTTRSGSTRSCCATPSRSSPASATRSGRRWPTCARRWRVVVPAARRGRRRPLRRRRAPVRGLVAQQLDRGPPLRGADQPDPVVGPADADLGRPRARGACRPSSA